MALPNVRVLQQLSWTAWTIDRCRKKARKAFSPKRSPMHALKTVRLPGDQLRRSNRPSRPSQSVRARPTCCTRAHVPCLPLCKTRVSNCHSSLGRGGRRLGLVVIVFKLLIREVFLQIDAGMFATETTALCKVPSVRIRRHTHRQEHRIPYTFTAKPKKRVSFSTSTCQGARVEGWRSEYELTRVNPDRC